MSLYSTQLGSTQLSCSPAMRDVTGMALLYPASPKRQLTEGQFLQLPAPVPSVQNRLVGFAEFIGDISNGSSSASGTHPEWSRMQCYSGGYNGTRYNRRRSFALV